MRTITYRCDAEGCSKEITSTLGLPIGWLSVHFWNQRDFYYHFCGYPHLTQWAEAREAHYQNKYAEEVADGENIKRFSAGIGGDE